VRARCGSKLLIPAAKNSSIFLYASHVKAEILETNGDE
jgi:hypothetical protein